MWVCPGPEQGPKSPPPTLHWNVVGLSSGAEKVKVGVASEVGPTGPESTVVAGATVSTVKLRIAGVSSAFDAASTAFTSNVWEPSGNEPAGVCESPGPEHGPKPASSILHRNVVELASVAEKVKVGLLSAVRPVGPESIAVSGAIVSTVKLRVAGESRPQDRIYGADLEKMRSVGEGRC